MPKRKYEEMHDKDGETADGVGDDSGGAEPNRKRSRKSVNFEKVHVFYFPRTQGFACVPSQGGTTLGMTEKHAHKEEYPFKHYRKLRKIVRRKKADIEETAENSFNIDSINEISQDEIIQTDSEEDDTETDGFFLQPVPTKLRRTLLKTAGIKKVDLTERDECKELRGSREVCGCECKTKCLPDTCLCAINGIQCQVDRFSFPCGCTQRGCSNPSGRIEFNPAKVHKHYQHTMTRLRTESELEEQRSLSPGLERSGYTSVKKARHIRFLENGSAVEGETSFNSTDTGCCLDCSLTSAPVSNDNQFDTNAADTAAAQLSVADPADSDCLSLDNHLAPSFGSCYPGDDGDDLSPSTPTLSIGSSYSNEGSLQPISGLLNPILNTVDSLDMYALAHIQPGSSGNSGDGGGESDLVAESGGGGGEDLSYSSDNAVSEWQTLSHESLLTTTNLIPMQHDQCNSSSDSATSSSSSASSATALSSTAPEQSDPLLNSFLQASTRPLVSTHLVADHNSEHVSFQFPSNRGDDSCSKEVDCTNNPNATISQTALSADASVS